MDYWWNGSSTSVSCKNIGPNSFAQLAELMGKNGTEANAAIIKALKADYAMKESRASSLIISGLKESTSSTTDEIYEDDIKEVKRLWTQSKLWTPTPLEVELDSNKAKNQVVASANKVAGESSFKDVYIRQNRTPVMQAEVNRL